MKLMKKWHLIASALLICVQIVSAQTDYRPGYIILNSGDTIHGQIDYRGDLLMGNRCRFKSADNTVQEYSPTDIMAYRFIDSKYFVSKEVDSKTVFLEYLINGKVNIYYLRDAQDGDSYFIEKDGSSLTRLPYDEGETFVGNKRAFYKTTKHIGLLNYYMGDAPELQTKIYEFGEPTHQNLIKLAEEYHNIVCDGDRCIIYEKKEPAIKVNFELVSGIINFENIVDLEDRNYWQNGLLAHFWLPRSNEKMYFKTGLLYSRPVQHNAYKTHIKIPLHFGYMAPSTYRVRPSASIGILSPSYSAGVSVKISKHLLIGVQGWANFNYEKMFWIPTKLNNYSVLGSIYFEP